MRGAKKGRETQKDSRPFFLTSKRVGGKNWGGGKQCTFYRLRVEQSPRRGWAGGEGVEAVFGYPRQRVWVLVDGGRTSAGETPGRQSRFQSGLGVEGKVGLASSVDVDMYFGAASIFFSAGVGKSGEGRYSWCISEARVLTGESTVRIWKSRRKSIPSGQQGGWRC